MVHKQGNHNKSNLKLRFLVGLIVFAVIVGFGTMSYTASAQNSITEEDEYGQLSFFDPFELTVRHVIVGDTLVIGSGGSVLQDIDLSSLVITRPPIRIPYKPDFRSPFQPGLPPWWSPGNPPWNP